MKSNDKQSQMAQLCREFAVEKAEIIEKNDKRVCSIYKIEYLELKVFV